MTDEALREFNRAAALDAKGSRAHYFLGLLYMAQNEWVATAQAREQFAEEVKVNPSDFFGNFFLGYIDNNDKLYDDSDRYLKMAAARQARLARALPLHGPQRLRAQRQPEGRRAAAQGHRPHRRRQGPQQLPDSPRLLRAGSHLLSRADARKKAPPTPRSSPKCRRRPWPTAAPILRLRRLREPRAPAWPASLPCPPRRSLIPARSPATCLRNSRRSRKPSSRPPNNG